MQLESPPQDPMSKDLHDLADRVRAVQRKRFLANASAFAVAALIIVAGVGLLGWIYFQLPRGGLGRFVVLVPFAIGLPAGWKVRARLWPKDPTI